MVASRCVAFGFVGKRTTQPVIYETLAAGAPMPTGRGPRAQRARRSTSATRRPSCSSGRGRTPVTDPFGRCPAAHARQRRRGSGFLFRKTERQRPDPHHLPRDPGRRPAHRCHASSSTTPDRARRPSSAPTRSMTSRCCGCDMDGLPRSPTLPLGDSPRVKVGDPTLAIANPFGLDRTLSERDRVGAAAPDPGARTGSR